MPCQHYRKYLLPLGMLRCLSLRTWSMGATNYLSKERTTSYKEPKGSNGKITICSKYGRMVEWRLFLTQSMGNISATCPWGARAFSGTMHPQFTTRLVLVAWNAHKVQQSVARCIVCDRVWASFNAFVPQLHLNGFGLSMEFKLCRTIRHWPYNTINMC
jgi:hypothetical protein